MTCPGCQKKMEKSALMGVWIRPDGGIQPYQVCVRCARILSLDGLAAKRQLTVRIEEVLTATLEAEQGAVH